MELYYYTTFLAALMVAILAGDHLMSSSAGAPICGTTPADDPKTFKEYADKVLAFVMEYTASQFPNSGPNTTLSTTYPKAGGSGSATATATCYEGLTARDCKKCLSDLLPYMLDCAQKYCATGGAYYEARCIMQYWQNYR